MRTTKHIHRLVLFSFIVTFALSRIVVFLIMSREIPDLYLHLGGTHIHHLNYGIFILSAVGGLLLFVKLPEKGLGYIAIAYGIGLALTFDEFGMWLHMGGGYWQRASFDAITVITGILLLLAFTPPIKYWSTKKIALGIFLTLLLSLFFWRLSLTLSPLAQRTLDKLESLEKYGPN